MHMQELHCTPYKLFHFVNEKFVYNQKKKKKTLFRFLLLHNISTITRNEPSTNVIKIDELLIKYSV